MPSGLSFEERCVQLVDRQGLATPGQVRDVEPLTGGVSSDIARVDLGGLKVCVKFALEKLKVAEDWQAPVDRNAAEYAWLEFVDRVVVGAVPKLFGRDTELNGFAMEYIDGGGIYLWKTAMLDRQPPAGEAALVGDTLGRIHSASTDSGFDASAFQNQQNFHALRLEPYLGFTAGVHPDLAPQLQEQIDSLQRRDFVLIHGDISPKNILFRNGQPVFLDAECATMGDPAFDVAFCLNHLLLKSCHMPDLAEALLAETARFWSSYAVHCGWEAPDALEARICALLPALMLARIDGKSPVEYLSDQTREIVRRQARRGLLEPTRTLVSLANEIRETARSCAR